MASSAKVILTRNVPKLGKLGEVKGVAPGFARNFLLPREWAVPFTEGALKNFDKRRSKLEAQSKEIEKESLASKAKLEGLKLEFPVLVDNKGELYGSVGKGQILKALKNKGFSLPHGARLEMKAPLKILGESAVVVELSANVTAALKVVLTPSHPAGTP